MKNNHTNSIITYLGVCGFLLPVIYLHIIQINTGYNPIYQHMSELALGKNGFLMVIAFSSLALSTLGTLLILATLKKSLSISSLLTIATISFIGAGIFKLGSYTELHVALVGLAFITLVLCMYLTPRLINKFRAKPYSFICWGLGASTAIFVACGLSILPTGLAQRLAATCLLLWFCWLATVNLNQGMQQDVYR